MTLSFHEKVAYFEETGEHFISLLEREDPHRTQTARKIIRSNMMRVQSTTLEELKEKRRVAMARKETDLRPYAALQRACAMAFANPTHKGDKWLNIFGASTSIALGVVVLALVMGAS